MPRISTDVSKPVKAWLTERAREEERSEAAIIRRVLEDAMKHDAHTASTEKVKG
jgi:hypothetical protein